MQSRTLRRWLAPVLTLTLLTAGVAPAQSVLLPNEAACAKVVRSESVALNPEFSSAVRATLEAYAGEQRRGFERFGTRPPTSAEMVVLESLSREVGVYAARLLKTIGWPADPALNGPLAELLSEPGPQWCAGQLALKVASTPVERSAAANLIDRGLVGLGAGQRYGTNLRQVGRRFVPQVIDDEAGVDARRAELGLPPMAEMLSQINAKLPERVTPAGLKRPVKLNPVCQPYTSEAGLNTPLTSIQLDTLEAEAGALVEEDQAARKGGSDIMNIDARSTAWLARTLKTSGWPSTSRADAQLAFNAWLLSQHADLASALQACVLDLLTQQKSTVREDQAFAYLTDRVRLAQGELQVYGTQVTYDDVQGLASPRPLIDPARVDERRARVGLEPLRDYLKVFGPQR